MRIRLIKYFKQINPFKNIKLIKLINIIKHIKFFLKIMLICFINPSSLSTCQESIN